ncbi:MAG: transglycosylase domain-containing protein, partial [Gemmatimonadetes bacterium]|nr:transglycosylase domain-containing protein [Gemmatimonadota bacterium]
EVLATARQLEREGLAWSQVPAEWREVLLQVEDPGFYEHHGVDVSTHLELLLEGLVVELSVPAIGRQKLQRLVEGEHP